MFRGVGIGRLSPFITLYHNITFPPPCCRFANRCVQGRAEDLIQELETDEQYSDSESDDEGTAGGLDKASSEKVFGLSVVAEVRRRGGGRKGELEDEGRANGLDNAPSEKLFGLSVVAKVRGRQGGGGS